MLYQFLDPTTSQATCANLDSTRSTVDEGLDGHEIGTEHTLGSDTNVLTDTTFLLRLTFSRNAVASNRALTANFTSTSHSYIHLVLDVLYMYSQKRAGIFWKALPGIFWTPVSSYARFFADEDPQLKEKYQIF